MTDIEQKKGLINLDQDDDGPIVVSKENILKYCEKNGLTLEQYKEKLEGLLREPRLMIERQFEEDEKVRVT